MPPFLFLLGNSRIVVRRVSPNPPAFVGLAVKLAVNSCGQFERFLQVDSSSSFRPSGRNPPPFEEVRHCDDVAEVDERVGGGSRAANGARAIRGTTSVPRPRDVGELSS
jgi:hypothetical protein